ETPYPGLRYYEDFQCELFAGRDTEVRDCTRLLGDARVLVLHGRSGCGKSSFLRAGVKPKLEKADPGSRFGATESGFDVTRSGADPLGAFAKKLLSVCEVVVKAKQSDYWKRKSAVDRAELSEFKKMYTAKLAKIGKNANETFSVLHTLTGLLKSSPIFVIDQAEEIFTLREKVEKDLMRARSDDPDACAELESRVDELEMLRREFFKFLGLMSEKGGRARLIISLRTEYKGQFDDVLASRRLHTERITGYYLRELTEDGLIEAIERPTLDKTSWETLQGSLTASNEKAPFDRYKFKYEDGVARSLAKSLTNPKHIPAGGVLPTLQIACLRLWRQSKQAAVSGRRFSINDKQLDRIGRVDEQMQEYINEQLEEWCSAQDDEWELGHTRSVERWHRILSEGLVDVQADGRAVSSSVTMQSLSDSAYGLFEGKEKKSKIQSVIEALCDPTVGILHKDRQSEMISLGHDSVALSLNKWNLLNNRGDTMMKRMSMGSGITPDRLRSDHLFPTAERPVDTVVTIHRDLHWDRQYPHFAEKSEFTERLGIRFVTKNKI
ncbi:MAG: hypothetical protein AAF402_17490, partial [Pseudomonadota bacterium]